MVSSVSTRRDPAPEHEVLRAEGISKRFGVTQALRGVTVSFRAGEVHALMGENGAGKSTLGKVIAGLHRADDGAVTLDGREIPSGSIDAAFGAGVRIVHQELAQCPNLSVAENLCLHDIPRTRLGLVDRPAMEDRARRLLARLDPDIDVSMPLGSLPPGRRQICQIAASLDDRSHEGGCGPRVIVFDEPTSSLTIAETERLLAIVRQLAREGITVVYVSHRMGEIFACCDRVTVLRDGQFVGTSEIADITEADLVEQMIGRRIETPTRGAHARRDSGVPAQPSSRNPALFIRKVRSPGKLRGVSLHVEPGEIVGIGGLVGAGRSELLDAIFGLDQRASGEVEVCGKRVPIRRTRDMIDAGVGYVPEDRRLQGLFFDLGIGENLLTPFMPQMSRFGIRNLAKEKAWVEERMREFQVKAAGPGAGPGTLSGGNQQKVLIARWMSDSTRVLLLDEPTRGIDVGTKAEIYRLVREAAERGTAVLLVSSEMPELLALSDRVLVMAGGRVTGELSGEEMTQRRILELATLEGEQA
ncbi:MAG: sugar ABC transporter ATP-binding protein [Phycisphaerales bacterium]|jgi:ABC-type sugar transport system ATPase subunit|nr:sugar ABC transporter ATP-binding protein [Phycisphaerales bacterium]